MTNEKEKVRIEFESFFFLFNLTGRQERLSSKTASRLSIGGPSSSTIIADGLLLTYDENHEWIWRYYVLDDFDLICFPADKKSHSNGQTFSDNEGSPLWVSDMTNAKVNRSICQSFHMKFFRFKQLLWIKSNVYVCKSESLKRFMFDHPIQIK